MSWADKVEEANEIVMIDGELTRLEEIEKAFREYDAAIEGESYMPVKAEAPYDKLRALILEE
jgi:hypothetical protein